MSSLCFNCVKHLFYFKESISKHLRGSSCSQVLVKMDLAILEAINYVKKVSKKKVSLENILQRINKTNATNIDIDTLRIDIDNILCKGSIIDIFE